MTILIGEHEEKLTDKIKIVARRLRRDKGSKDKDPESWRMGPTSNELTARIEVPVKRGPNKTKPKDFIRMIVAECMVENLPEFCRRAVKELDRNLAGMNGVDKLDHDQVITVKVKNHGDPTVWANDSFREFAYALARSHHYERARN